MNSPTSSHRRLHPLIAVAAGSVIVASLAATAAVTGLFPKASSSNLQSGQAQTSQVASSTVVDSSAPAPAGAMTGQQQAAQATDTAQPQTSAQNPGQVPSASQPVRPSYARPSVGQEPPASQQLAQQPYAQPQDATAQPAYCASCGTVESVVAVKHPGQGTGIGAVGGAVVGGLLGNQFGRGTGRLGMTALGAVGGGFAGNTVEKHLRGETDYQVRVRMENGRLRYFTYREAPPFQQGERVHVEHGALTAG